MKKTLFVMVKYVVVHDLVFLLVWMLALTTIMSRSLSLDSRRHGEAKSPGVFSVNLAKEHVVIFALCDIPTLSF